MKGNYEGEIQQLVRKHAEEIEDLKKQIASLKVWQSYDTVNFIMVSLSIKKNISISACKFDIFISSHFQKLKKELEESRKEIEDLKGNNLEQSTQITSMEEKSGWLERTLKETEVVNKK